MYSDSNSDSDYDSDTLNYDSDRLDSNYEATILERYQFSKSQNILTLWTIDFYLKLCIENNNTKNFILIFEECYKIISKKSLYLHQASYWGNIEIIQYLHEKYNCDVNYLSDQGNPPLYLSIERNFENITRYLLIHGANINLLTSKTAIKNIQNQILYPVLLIKYSELIHEPILFKKIWKYYQ